MEPQETLLNKFLKLSLVILIIIFIGFGGFVLLDSKKTSSDSITKISPTVIINKNLTITPTVTVTEDPNDINIGSVEADLKDIETDIKDLQ